LSGKRDLIALDDAVTSLSTTDARMGQLLGLRFFGGLNIEEA